MKRFLVLLLACSGFAVSAQFAQFPNDTGKFLSGANTWLTPSIISNVTAAGSFQSSVATLTAASAGTNYGVDVGTSSAGFINMTTNVAITGFTNMAAGSSYRLLIVNASGSNFNITAPATSFKSGYAAANDLPTVLTNGTAASLEIFGYGTTTNAVIRFTRYTK